MRVRTQWMGKAAFADLAAALAVPQDLIMGAMQQPGGAWTILYSDGPDLDSEVWMARVQDGVVLDREATGQTVADYLPPLPH